MTSKREQALQGLFVYLRDNLPEVSVLRNEVLNTSVPKTGLIILRDGNPGDPEILLSPPHYIYKHRAEVEVLIQNPDPTAREIGLDDLIVEIGSVLKGAATLEGVIDFLSVGSPELLTEPIEGAAVIKAAVIPITLEYVTQNPLI